MSSAESMVGVVLNGTWKLAKLLGEGGMGAVFAAEGVHGEGKRAIKLLHPEWLNEPQILQRFLAEAFAAQQLQHPNVAKVYEHAQAEDTTPYLVMELLDGISLSEYVQPNNPIAPRQAAPIVYGVLQALIAAHAQGIVHRDLKPENVFLVPDAHGRYTVKVLDFGVAKVMDAAGGMGSKTRTGMMLGTPGYMSPEQVKNAKAVDHRSDLWSVGVMFYEMLTGREAFEAPTDFAKLTAVLAQDPIPISQIAPHLAGWHDFFSRAMARDPDSRFATADDMARTLLATARALAGAAPLPTAEFRSVEVQQRRAAAIDTHKSVGRDPTQASPQMSVGRQPSSRPPPSALGQVVTAPPLRDHKSRTGVAPGVVAVIALLCLVFGFAVGLLTMWMATQL